MAVFDLDASHDSWYRADTLNFDYTASGGWPVRVTSSTGTNLTDSDGNGWVDIAGVIPGEPPVPVPMQVRVDVPVDAAAGDRDTVWLVIASTNYPFDYPETNSQYPDGYYAGVLDTTVLIAHTAPIPGILLRPDQQDSVAAGNTVRYAMEVFNNGNGPDTPSIQIQNTTQPGWGHDLIDGNGVDPLQDSNGDGIPDVGHLDKPPEVNLDSFYLDVSPPHVAGVGDVDTTVLTATSAHDPAVYDSVMIVTYVLSSMVVDIHIWQSQTKVIGADETASYDLYITNNGDETDIIDCGQFAIDDLGWTGELTDVAGHPFTDHDNNGHVDVGGVGVMDTIMIHLEVTPPTEVGSIVSDFDTELTDQRYVWIQTGYAVDTEVRDSVLITTILEPEFHIHNYPNPFRDATTFTYNIPRAGIVTLQVYNRSGEHIKTLVHEQYLTYGGTFEAEWNGLTKNGKRPAPGVYIYVLDWCERKEGDTFARSKRIVKKALLQP
ncbi:hypothetical protein GF338_02025 [candidate division WOR-3 bacterium]|nr:hypothetical protein [candidate division WOR-3 bacterium]